MPREFPPFGGTDDPDIENALQWFLGFLDPDDWKTRVAAIERDIESGMQPRTRHFDAEDYVSAYGGRDRIAWYLYLVDTAQHDPLKYEPTQGARVIPIFKRLGADLGLLKRIGGVEERVQRLLGGERAQPDGGLFELLVALLWKRNGYPTVEFIPECPPGKSPDILARSAREEWFVECKRLQKSSAYSERERQKWLAMWSRFARHLTRHNLSLVFEITFHVELASLPDDFLVAQLAGKLPFLSFPCHIASNETWDVTARPVDYRRARAHLRRYRVRIPSDQMQELLAGDRDPRRGFTGAAAGDVVRIGGTTGNNRFLDSLSLGLLILELRRTAGRPAQGPRRARPPCPRGRPASVHREVCRPAGPRDARRPARRASETRPYKALHLQLPHPGQGSQVGLLPPVRVLCPSGPVLGDGRNGRSLREGSDRAR